MGIITGCFLTLSILFCAFRLLVKSYRRGLRLPPGPTGIPILGNILQVQAQRDVPLWIEYSNWAQTYGDVFSFSVFGSRTVVLNSYKAITELLEHRSHNYSDRPRQTMLVELMRWNWMFSLMEYSDQWRLHRKTFHQSFHPRSLSEYHDIQRRRTAQLVKKLLTSPNDFFQHVRMHSGGIILEAIYGYCIQDNNDPYVKLADDLLLGAGEAGAYGAFLVDYIPMLRYVPAWFPGATFKAKADLWARESDRLKDIPWVHLKQSIEDGTAVPCFSTRNLEEFGISRASNNNPEMEEVIKNCAAIAFIAGADTTVSVILTFILAMVLNPQVQVRAQKELDRVTGSSGFPDFADRESLPYVNAVLAETLRWNPVTRITLPHRVVNDDVYEGYFIPAGSTILPNAWAVLHDESLYGPDPTNFNPDRFLKSDEKDLPPNPELIAFGFGRRSCPGRHFAVNTVWIAMTYLLTAFTMGKEVDEDGKEIDPVVEYTDALSTRPLPFNCRFISRSPA
ncbi:hypothetical protein E1B28_013424 [Marasmius oreades]|uniref:Cytochrome P450 n=1 Tax=Marasmius oreades TaxID=181124 RepID=A0A9P7RQD4_9AGAR|nr:uncharacterized protein E1B28_013424 [Marasmius oreades]KAG7087458.1 hypothetical protein E1B28_013424 [Marasmius oreades]